MIDWNSVISNLENGSIVSVDSGRWNLKNPKYSEILKLWTENNFNTASVKWINYYGNKTVEEEVANRLNLKVERSWISCVEPGYMTGYHYDIDDNEQEYLKKGILKRYSIFISEPDVGHLFILDKEYYYNKPQGSILEWKHHREWHNGINGGLTNKFMYHILGH